MIPRRPSSSRRRSSAVQPAVGPAPRAAAPARRPCAARRASPFSCTRSAPCAPRGSVGGRPRPSSSVAPAAGLDTVRALLPGVTVGARRGHPAGVGRRRTRRPAARRRRRARARRRPLPRPACPRRRGRRRRCSTAPTRSSPALPLADTVKRVDADRDRGRDAVPRADLRAVQTPQGFRAAVLERRRTGSRPATTPPTTPALVEALGVPVRTVPGARGGVQGDPPDRPAARRGRARARPVGRGASVTAGCPRVGVGVDVHPFAGRTGRCTSPGLHWPGEPGGLAGHSDGDVVAHAACDALLGAAGPRRPGQQLRHVRPGAGPGPRARRCWPRPPAGSPPPAGSSATSSVQLIGNRPRLGPRRAEAEQVLTAAVGAPRVGLGDHHRRARADRARRGPRRDRDRAGRPRLSARPQADRSVPHASPGRWRGACREGSVLDVDQPEEDDAAHDRHERRAGRTAVRSTVSTRGPGAVPDDGHRYELIDGTLLVSPSPCPAPGRRGPPAPAAHHRLPSTG